MGYQIFVFFFTLGVVCGSVNALGVFQHKLPNPSYTLSGSTLNKSVSGAKGAELNFFTAWEVFWTLVSVILYGFLACISIAAVFYGMGLPMTPYAAVIIQMFQTPVFLVGLFWIYEQVTQRSVE